MRLKIILSGLLLLRLSVCNALPRVDAPNQTLGDLDAESIALWSVGLLAVMGVFLLGFWGVLRKFGGAGRMRVAGGLSLGMWEKIVLLQVGKKQLILGVTPGRIQTLHVLEGDDGLIETEMAARAVKGAKTENLAVTEANRSAMNGPVDRSARIAEPAEQKMADEEPSCLAAPRGFEKHLAHVRRLADENPKLVAHTLKAWIRDE